MKNEQRLQLCKNKKNISVLGKQGEKYFVNQYVKDHGLYFVLISGIITYYQTFDETEFRSSFIKM